MIVTVNFGGAQIFAEPKEKLPDGSWVMVSRSHHPRFSDGTQIRVTPDEIVDAGPIPIEQQLSAALARTWSKDMPTADMGQIDILVGLTKTVGDLKVKAADAVAKFKGSTANLEDAVQVTHTVSDQLDKAASDIRDAFGVKTNAGPPLNG